MGVMATVPRQIRRLEAALAKAKETEGKRQRIHQKFVARMRKEISRLKGQANNAKERAKNLQKEMELERLKRISAQRGLVNYMREHGLADRIGYDPDKDPAIRVEIRKGKIPRRDERRVIQEIAGLVIKARSRP
jgi:hypothetical protein